jgi:uncharacterized protein (TIGR03118 family)
MQRRFNRIVGLPALLALVVVLGQSMAQAQYKITTLVTNATDSSLVNAWGLTSGSSTFFWVSDNGSGVSTLYDGHGVKQGLTVAIPPASGTGPGSPTGIVFNGSSDFVVSKNGLSGTALFLFATLDGTISGWSPGVDLNNAIIAVPSSGAVYTGLAITSDSPGGTNLLYAADAANNKVDVYDGNFKLVRSFTDPHLPATFAPYGIQVIKNRLFVTFASNGNVAGGIIDIFTEEGVPITRLASGGPLNQPWGMALAPSNFGPFSHALLVSNNLPNGTINAFSLKTGKFLGSLRNEDGKPLIIDQIWGMAFGAGNVANGPANQLFFTAGPINYANGAFGKISFAPDDDATAK